MSKHILAENYERLFKQKLVKEEEYDPYAAIDEPAEALNIDLHSLGGSEKKIKFAGYVKGTDYEVEGIYIPSKGEFRFIFGQGPKGL